MYILKIPNMHVGDVTHVNVYIALGFSNLIVVQE